MNNDLVALRQFILKHFSLEELRTLCFDLYIEYDDLPGEGRAAKVRELVKKMDRDDRLSDLHPVLAREHPDSYRQQFGRPQSVSQPLHSPLSTPHSPLSPPRNPRQIFISHAHQDADFAHRLAADLQTAGWTVWIAPDHIRPGERWVEAINRALEESGVFVLVVTPAAVASRWVQTETNIAIEMEHEKELRLIPLQVETARTPAVWRAYQRVPFDAGYNEGLARLIAWLGGAGQLAESDEPIMSQPDVSDAGLDSKRPTKVSRPRKQKQQPAARHDRRIHEKTGIELIRIPAGPFLYGSRDDDQLADDNEKPQRRIELAEFWIGRAPVTNAQFAHFVEATGYRTNAEQEGGGWGWSRNWGRWDVVKGAYWRRPQGKRFYSIVERMDDPVVQVSWDDVNAFCEWAGLQLPTEQEWEKAARGTDGRLWPWGNTPPTNDLCNFNKFLGTTTAVGRYAPQADSPYGCVDMAGNVWEWTTSWTAAWFPAGEEVRVRRGGAWTSSDRATRTASRPNIQPHDISSDVGFRVVEHLHKS